MKLNMKQFYFFVFLLFFYASTSSYKMLVAKPQPETNSVFIPNFTKSESIPLSYPHEAPEPIESSNDSLSDLLRTQTEAIKELSKKIDALSERVNHLENKPGKQHAK